MPSRCRFGVVELIPAAVPQASYGPGSQPSICAATVSGATVQALCNVAASQAIETQCAASPNPVCATTLALLAANHPASPYSPGLLYEEFDGQRAIIFHYNYASCSSASTSAWESTGCENNLNQTASALYDPAMVIDGSPCLTVQTVSAARTVESCPGESPQLKKAKFYVWAGLEDLVIRHDYGQALCTWPRATATPARIGRCQTPGTVFSTPTPPESIRSWWLRSPPRWRCPPRPVGRPSPPRAIGPDVAVHGAASRQAAV
jgi:hypothetical protein